MDDRPVQDLYEEHLEKLFLGLRYISHISSIYSKYLQKYLDITTSQLLFLRALDKEDLLSSGEISRRIFIKPGTITGIVDRLEKKGLVTRNRDNQDRRVVKISITEAGRELVRAAPVPIQSRLAINLKKLPFNEVESITKGLERLVDLMHTEEVGTEIARAEADETTF